MVYPRTLLIHRATYIESRTGDTLYLACRIGAKQASDVDTTQGTTKYRLIFAYSDTISEDGNFNIIQNQNLNFGYYHPDQYEGVVVSVYAAMVSDRPSHTVVDVFVIDQ